MSDTTCQRRADRLDWALAVFWAVLAAAPRLSYLNLAEFKLDEATHYQMAYGLLRGAWRWVGSTASVGLPKPALLVYVLALPMQLTRDPRVITAFLGLLAALSAGGFYLILRRFLGKAAACVAALLFVVNPQAILYARKLFTADLIPPLCTLFLSAAVAFLSCSARRIGWFAALTAFAFSLLLLDTFSPMLLFPALVTVFWLRRRDLELRHYVGALLAFVLPLLPYLVTVLPYVKATVGSTSASAGAHPPLVSWIWNLLFGAPWPSDEPRMATAAAVAIALLSVGGLAWLLNAALKRESRDWAVFFLAWLCLAPLLALVVPITLEMHYLVVLYPLIFVLPAAGVELARRRSRLLGWGALALVALTAAWQMQVWVNILKSVSRGVEGYGTPLGYWWDAVQRARDVVTEHQAAEVLLVMPGDQPWDEKAHVLDVLLSDTPHRVVNGYLSVLYPSHSAVSVVASELADALSLTASCTQDLGDPLPASPFGGEYHYYLWQPDLVQATTCAGELQLASAQWGSGVRLLGYGVQGRLEPGQMLQVYLLWETTRGPLDADVHWYNRLTDQAQHRWAEFDHVGWPAARWQPGDRVLTHFSMTVSASAAPGPYVLNVGQYTYPALVDIPALDAQGNPVDYSVQLQLPQR